MTKQLSEGEQIMRIDFDKPEDSSVYQIKQKAAEMINLIGDSVSYIHNREESLRLAIRAIETCEIASMLAVKAVTTEKR